MVRVVWSAFSMPVTKVVRSVPIVLVEAL